MAQITLTIPDTDAQRILNGFAASNGYSPNLEDGSPNPETKLQFTKRALIDFIKSSVRRYEQGPARAAAEAQVAQAVDSIAIT